MEKMGSHSCNSSRKPVRRRCHKRKTAQCSVINMAEARREIAHALHLHRSSSSSPSTSTKTAAIPYVAQETEGEPRMVGNPHCSYSTKMPALAASYCCYSLVEAAMPLPLPEPLWSTTAPSVPPAPPGLEAMEFFELGENQASASSSSSYSWWLAFLKALDDGNNIEKTKHPFVDNAIKENSTALEQQQSSKLREPTNFSGASDHNASLDEWLMFPATEDDS